MLYDTSRAWNESHFDHTCPHQTRKSDEPDFVTIERKTFFSTPTSIPLHYACKYRSMALAQGKGDRDINGIGQFETPFLCNGIAGDYVIMPSYPVGTREKSEVVDLDKTTRSFFKNNSTIKSTMSTELIVIIVMAVIMSIIIMITGWCYCKTTLFQMFCRMFIREVDRHSQGSRSRNQSMNESFTRPAIKAYLQPPHEELQDHRSDTTITNVGSYEDFEQGLMQATMPPPMMQMQPMDPHSRLRRTMTLHGDYDTVGRFPTGQYNVRQHEEMYNRMYINQGPHNEMSISTLSKDSTNKVMGKHETAL